MKRQTFLDKPVTEKQIKHLRIIITDKNEDNEFLTVSVDKYISKFQDNSCLINVGEHPFIKQLSFVNYRYAKVLSFSQIYNGIFNKKLIRKEDVSVALLQKIQQGAKNTKFLDNKFKKWFVLF